MKILMNDMDKLNADMVTGVYFKRQPNYAPVIFDELDEPYVGVDKKPIARVSNYYYYPKDSIFKVKGCGFGCVLTTTKLLKHVWDEYGPAFSPYPWGGEDISFCHRVNELGYDIWCDSNVSLGHIGTYVYTESNFKRGDED